MPQRRTSKRIQVVTVARAGWAAVLLLAPQRVLGVGGQPAIPAPAVVVARVLGARHLLQSALTAAAPTGSLLAAGAAVDAVHAGTDVGLAAVSPRWRRIALVDAVIAAAFAAAGWSSGPGRSRHGR
jgi:hypothetical protein